VELFSTFITKQFDRVRRKATHNELELSKDIIKRFTRFLRKTLVLTIISISMRSLNLR
jgi:hypothetical protein